jgi:cell wall-associated NlpC family hydrolase
MATSYSSSVMDAAKRMLTASGLPTGPDQQRLMAGWIQSEGGLQNNNPLNTTLRAAGRTGTVNSVGVGKFGTLDQGIAADAQTLANARYAGIRSALQGGNQNAFVQAVGSSPWGTSSDLLGRVLGTTPAGPTQPSVAPAPTKVTPPKLQQPTTPAVDETDAMLRGEFSALMAGGKVRPIDVLTGGMTARDNAAAQNAQRAAELARQAKTIQQQKNPVSPNTPAGQTTGMNPPDPNAQGAGKATSWALNNLGIPYSWGGGSTTGPTKGFGRGAGTVGYDCSSFVQAAMAQAGVKVPRTTYDQMKVGRAVPNLATAQPGDMLFPTAGHVMLYLGNGQAAEAPHTGDVSKVIPVTGMSFVSIRRVL